VLRPNLHPLAWALALALASPAVRGNDTAPGPDWALCRAPAELGPFRSAPAPAGRDARQGSPVTVQSDALNVSGEKVTVFSGAVELARADQWVGTEALRYQHEDGTWQSPGPLRFEDEGLRLRAARAEGDEAKERVTLHEVQYQLVDGTLGNGTARTVVREGTNGTLFDAEFSTCPPGQRQWAFHADTLEIDDKTQRGVARNATLRIGGVPVFWMPWISFPTTDARKTGLLAPKIGFNDRNGFDYEQPIYLNLAPHMDATLAPRWMAKRGLMLGGEFRYLTERHSGRLEGHWLHDDDTTGDDRGLLRWQHLTAINPQWFATADLQDVSDREYLRDFGNDFGQNTLSLLESQLALNGRGRTWSTRLSVERWQAANPAILPGTEPYARLPRLRTQWLQPLASWLDVGVDSETVRFDHESLAGGRRIDLRPNLRLAFGGASWFLNPELAWRYTGYSLERDPMAPARDRNPSRSLPIGSLDMGLFFEREARLFGRSMVQTLEPRLYYLRVPYREQSTLPLFDTQPLSFSWPGLFRQNRYTGADRQGDANQATLALTTRFLDADDGRERLSASLGRIHFFDTPRVAVPGERTVTASGSAYVGELDWHLSDSWSVSVAQQWNPGLLGTDLSAVRSQWRFSERGVLNASYRYRKDLLEQTDLSFAAPIDVNWRLVGRWAWSVRDRRTLEALSGLEWRSCCVAVRVLARDYIRDVNAKRNLGLYLEIELNGLGSFGRDSERLLSDVILGYSP
jgi:LPS-assembly protein